VVATTHSGGVPIIRAVARVGSKIAAVARGQLTYVTRVNGKLIAGNYPYVGEIADAFELVSLEFLAKDHPVYALRPSSPLQRIEGWCWYAPRDSFAYPGGEYEYTP
jgi:hypothetical protein